jgi:phosphate-selective porin OprO/OprP
MIVKAGFGAAFVCLLIGATPSALAQSMSAEEAAALRAQVAALKAQVEQLESRLDRLAPAASASAPAAGTPSAAPPVLQAATAQPDYKVSWKGAPEISTSSGWSFKPRGRLQFDTGTVIVPTVAAGLNPSVGWGTELRRAYLGAQGTIPGGFGYRVDVDFGQSSPEFTDTYLTWDRKAWNVTVGQHFPFVSLDQQTSDLDTSFLERAAFDSAFNFERRIGVSVGYNKGMLLVNGGAFTDNIADLSSDANNSYSFDGRIVLMPKIGDVQLHLAGSAHWRELGKQSAFMTRYRARPYERITDLRFVDTGSLNVETELNYGLEAAAVAGPFHVAAEANWMRPTFHGIQPTFFGGYAEVGYFLTRGDTRPYKKGAWGSIKPARGLDAGGPGAIQVNVRFDRLDLSDRPIIGGTQDSYLASIIWTPVEHLRFMANYGHLLITDAAIATIEGRTFNGDIAAMRAQVDF